MKMLKQYAIGATACCLALVLSSCEGRRTADDTTEITVETESERDTARIVRSGETVDEKVEELRGWLNQRANNADTAIRENWPETREKLRDINADIERNFDSLSTEGKEEYRRLQEQYARWEKEQEQRLSQPLKTDVIKTWEQQLLREHANIGNIPAQNMREAYLTFMGSVRTKQRSYTQNDWDYVDHVYSNLNQRRRQVENDLSTGDKLKIRALQAEYLALEGAADTRSMVRGAE